MILKESREVGLVQFEPIEIVNHRTNGLNTITYPFNIIPINKCLVINLI